MLAIRSKFTFFPGRRAARSVCLFALFGVYASAGVVTFTSEDLNAGPGNPHPNADTTATSFATAAGAIGTIGLITFEGLPVGSFTTLVVAPGVTISGVDGSGNNLYINNVPNFPGGPALDGFNTTPGGANYVEMKGGRLTFTFATPIQFFAAILTGVQTNFFQDTVTFGDGSSQLINVPGTGTNSSNGALDFVGFTDAGKSITSVSINAGTNGQDFIGVDDVRFQTVAPEPSPVWFVLAGCVVLALGLRRYRIGRG